MTSSSVQISKIDGKRPRPDWRAIFAVLGDCTGTCSEQYQLVEQAFRSGELSGAKPSFSGFWRQWLAWSKTHAAGVSVASESNQTPDPVRIAIQEDYEAGPVDQEAAVDITPQKDSLPTARACLAAEERRLLGAAGQLNAAGLLTTEKKAALRKLLKKAKRPSSMSDKGLRTVAEQFKQRAREYEQQLPAGDNSNRKELAIPRGTHSETVDLTALGPSTELKVLLEVPLDVVPASDSKHIVPDPDYRAVVGRVSRSKTADDALLRTRLVAPVLNGFMSASELAYTVQKLAHGSMSELRVDGLFDIVDFLGTLPPEILWRYRKLNRSTVNRWAKAVKDEQAQANTIGTSVPPVVDILQHRQPDNRDAARIVTAEIEEKVRGVYKDHPNFSMAAVGRHVAEYDNIQLSTRTIQRILSGTISDLERALARGGDAADVVMRTHLYRDVKTPNDTWICDHSFIRQELLDPDHPEYIDEVHDFDWECDVAVEQRNRFGIVTRERHPVHVTIWVDAATRKVLSLRVWPGAPNTMRTIASLFDAVRMHGLPKRIYTDNGTDFRSHALQDLLTQAGINHAFSRPYSPQGRGIIERLFGTIKQMVMPHIPGYQGGRHKQVWDVADLLTVEELEDLLWRRVDELINHRIHGSTKQKPAEHYNALIGARDLAGMAPTGDQTARFLSLLLTETRILHEYGIDWYNLPYYLEHMGVVPIDTEVHVHHEPFRWKHIYISVPQPDGTLAYLGRATAYDLNNPPPEIGEVRKVEALWRAHVTEKSNILTEERERRARTERSRAEGAEIAEYLTSDIDQELAVLSSSMPRALLPESSGTEIEVSTADEDEPAEGLLANQQVAFAEKPEVRRVRRGGRSSRAVDSIIISPFE